MADRDFFDEELTESAAPAADPSGMLSAGALSAAARRRMKQQKEELTTQAADASREIETLRSRQSALERERAELEELARKQEHYEEAKREILDRLRRSLQHLEKDESQAARFLELLSVMRDRFKDTLAELEGISESGWAEDAFETELNKALVLVEDANAVYRKGIARIRAEAWQDVREGKAEPAVLRKADAPEGVPRGFGFWFKAGAAFTLPLILLAALVAAGAMLLRTRGWW